MMSVGSYTSKTSSALELGNDFLMLVLGFCIFVAQRAFSTEGSSPIMVNVVLISPIEFVRGKEMLL